MSSTEPNTGSLTEPFTGHFTERRRVVITGSGLVSPLADNGDDLHAALCRGESGLGEVAFDEDPEPGPHLAGRIDFDARHYLPDGKIRPLDRTGRLVIAAARLALRNAGLDEETCAEQDIAEQDVAEQEIGFVLGTLYCSLHTIAAFDQRALEAGPQYVRPFDFANSVINAAAGQTAIWHRLRGINATLAGTTAGLEALAYATDLIASGRADIVLAGGGDELCFESHLAFRRSGLTCAGDDPRPVPFDGRRNGLALSESAAILVLESAESARRRGATVLGEICGHASAFDPSRGRDAATSGATIERNVRAALRHARLEPDDLDAFGASANGTAALDHHEAMGAAAAFAERSAPLPVTAVKSMAGESLGAAGAVQALSMVESLRRGELPGIRGFEGRSENEPGVPALSFAADTRTLPLPANGRRHGLVSSVGLDGQVCALLLAGPEGSAAGAAQAEPG